MKLPNFFIIGAPKCGTTSLARWLSEHPNIYFSPVKEPFYFSEDIFQKFTSWEEYLNLFNGAGEEHLAVGEGSTTYLYSEVAVKAIEDQFDKPRYIIMIRNPVEMAYSLHYQQLVSFNETIEDFITAWRLSPERRKGNHLPPGSDRGKVLDLQSICKLGEQVERVFQSVEQERILVLSLDDLRADAKQAYESVLSFLQVPSENRTEFPVYNPAKRWRSKWAGRLYRQLNRLIVYIKYRKGFLKLRSLGILESIKKRLVKRRNNESLPQDVIEELQAYYAEDVRKLSQLLKVDYYQKWNFPS